MTLPNKQPNHRKRILYSLAACIAVAAFVFTTAEAKQAKTDMLIRACNEAQLALAAGAFSGSENILEAKSAYVYDFTHQRSLYAKDTMLALPLASLTKLMTVRVALEEAEGEEYRITEADLAPLGDSGLKAGMVLTTEDLVRAALVASSNDAATALSHAARGPGTSVPAGTIS